MNYCYSHDEFSTTTNHKNYLTIGFIADTVLVNKLLKKNICMNVQGRPSSTTLTHMLYKNDSDCNKCKHKRTTNFTFCKLFVSIHERSVYVNR